MDLPPEVIQHIFYFLNPCEIVQLRQVSKQLREITYTTALWRDIYSNADFLLPPGPFSSQSARHLECTLVRSDRLCKTWTSQPFQVLSRTSISREREKGSLWTVFFGRWCIYLDGKTVQCHDIDTNTRHLLYDGTPDLLARFVACSASATDINGSWAFLLLTGELPGKKLLGFHVTDNSFSGPEIIVDLAHFESQSIDSWQLTIEFDTSTPFMSVRYYEPRVVLDLRTRRLHKLPAPRIPNDLANKLQLLPSVVQPEYFFDLSTELILTRTHVVAVQMYKHTPSCPSWDVPVLIRAFIVPDSAALSERNKVSDLRLTHEVAMHGAPMVPHSLSLLRNSVIDPVTGSANVRLLQITTSDIDRKQKQMSCLDLTFPKPVTTTGVMPISIQSQCLFESTWSSERCTVSDNGHGRGLLLTESGPPYFCIDAVRKFTIDASGEECTMVVGEWCPFELRGDPDDVLFDGTRGWIHHFQFMNYLNHIITLDVA